MSLYQRNNTPIKDLELHGIKTSLLTDRKASKIPCYKSPDFLRTENLFFEARNGTRIRLRIEITSSFMWYEANTLCVQVRLGQVNPLKSFRIEKVGNGAQPEVVVDTWTVWDNESQKWCNAQFEICLDDVSSQLCQFML